MNNIQNQKKFITQTQKKIAEIPTAIKVSSQNQTPIIWQIHSKSKRNVATISLYPDSQETFYNLYCRFVKPCGLTNPLSGKFNFLEQGNIETVLDNLQIYLNKIQNEMNK